MRQPYFGFPILNFIIPSQISSLAAALSLADLSCTSPASLLPVYRFTLLSSSDTFAFCLPFPTIVIPI